MSDELIHDHLAAAAAARPGHPAVRDGERVITYRDLEARANQLAHLLRHAGVGAGDRVAMCVAKSIESIIAVYGILKAGAAYVPLDPSPRAPVQRQRLIIRDCQARWLVTGARTLSRCAELADAQRLDRLISLDSGDEAAGPDHVRVDGRQTLDAQSTRPPENVVRRDDLAYVLYTSGSTGVPKGVMLSHGNCMAFVDWAVAEFAVGHRDVLSNHAPLHFDLSTFDLFAAAVAGAQLDLVPPGASALPYALARHIRDHRITVWYSVPSALIALLETGGLEDHEFPDLRVVLFAGERFPPRYLARLMRHVPHAAYANLYGPTETNVCTYHRLGGPPPDELSAIPIGRPIAGVETFVVRADGSIAGRGEDGQLCVVGPTTMRGYSNDPRGTARRLCADPRSGSAPGARCYQTGDLVRERDDGGYEFLGRTDDQIKSRGYRIELGEIEAALYGHPGVVHCAVVAVPDPRITNRIQAVVVMRPGASLEDLRQHCRGSLAGHMIPETWRICDQLPLTATGKVDRSALLAEAVAGAGRGEPDG